MRMEVAPFKGMMSGPGARAPFDEVIELTPDARGVTYEKVAVGGVPGIRCTPEGARPGAALLYLHGGAYVLGSANAYRHFAGQIAARAKVARAAGVEVVAHVWEGMMHVFPSSVGTLEAAEKALNLMASFLDEWPSTGPDAGAGHVVAAGRERT